MYYECHITLEPPANVEKLKSEIIAHFWKFSQITGDPTLGNKQFCYATKHVRPDRTLMQVVAEMNCIARALALHGRVVRQKVELVLYDEHTIKLKEQIG